MWVSGFFVIRCIDSFLLVSLLIFCVMFFGVVFFVSFPSIMSMWNAFMCGSSFLIVCLSFFCLIGNVDACIFTMVIYF